MISLHFGTVLTDYTLVSVGNSASRRRSRVQDSLLSPSNVSSCRSGIRGNGSTMAGWKDYTHAREEKEDITGRRSLHSQSCSGTKGRVPTHSGWCTSMNLKWRPRRQTETWIKCLCADPQIYWNVHSAAFLWQRRAGWLRTNMKFHL